MSSSTFSSTFSTTLAAGALLSLTGAVVVSVAEAADVLDPPDKRRSLIFLELKAFDNNLAQ